ncbi:unnamed protein product [Dicrocoelium dendriticum]|nr:unnamed protein product [Dicrocoelium dendriticum]
MHLILTSFSPVYLILAPTSGNDNGGYWRRPFDKRGCVNKSGTIANVLFPMLIFPYGKNLEGIEKKVTNAAK